MNKITYENLLEKNEVPNGPQMMLEVGMLKREYGEFKGAKEV